ASSRQREAAERRFHPTLRTRDVQLPPDDQDSAGLLFYDGRQSWAERRQPLLGTSPKEVDHRTGLLHLLAAQANRDPLNNSRLSTSRQAGRRSREAGARRGGCFGSIAGSSGDTWAAPARQAAGAPPGPSLPPPARSTTPAAPP